MESIPPKRSMGTEFAPGKENGVRFVDTHAHLDHARLLARKKHLMTVLPQMGIEKVIIPAITYESSFSARETFDPLPWIYYGPGIHPNHVPMLRELGPVCTEGLCELIQQPRTVALKTGLDYYRTTDPVQQARQREWFRRILSIAQDVDLPLILHIRQAGADAFRILREMGGMFSGVVHCYNGTYETAMQYADMGLCLGIGGAVTYDLPEFRDAVARMPMGQILLETDAPFVRPVSIPDGPNTPEYLPVIAETIAELRGTTVETIAEETTRNAYRVFRFC